MANLNGATAGWVEAKRVEDDTAYGGEGRAAFSTRARVLALATMLPIWPRCSHDVFSLTIDSDGKWRLYNLVLLPGWEAVGTVTVIISHRKGFVLATKKTA